MTRVAAPSIIGSGNGKIVSNHVFFKGRPIGASIVGKNAGEIIQIWCLAISSKLKMSAISSMVSPYPTLGELNKRVSNAYLAPKLINSVIIKRFVRFIQKF
jgi:hypothetical protein